MNELIQSFLIFSLNFYIIGTIGVNIMILFYMFMVIPPRLRYYPVMLILSFFWPVWIWFLFWAFAKITIKVLEVTKKPLK